MDRQRQPDTKRQQRAFVVRSLLIDGMPEAFSQQIDGTPGTDLRMEDLLEAGWTVVSTEAMPGGFESTCLVVLQSPASPAPQSRPAKAASIPLPKQNSREPRQESMEWHAPGLAAWDGETISLERLGIR